MDDRHDDSMLDTVRNYLRDTALPLLTAGFIGLASCTPDAADHCQEKMDYLTDTGRDQLTEHIARTLAAQEHTYRSMDGGFDYSEGFLPRELADTELQDIASLLQGLQDPETLEDIGRLVQKDLQEGQVTLHGIKSLYNLSNDHRPEAGIYTLDEMDGEFTVQADETELLGLVHREHDGFSLQPYQPLEEYGDTGTAVPVTLKDIINTDSPYSGGTGGMDVQKALLPVEEDTAEHSACNDPALATFHLHAVDQDGNPEGAGPSGGDLEGARRFEEPGVVITFLGTDREGNIQVNLDYYTAQEYSTGNFSIQKDNAVVIDLGDYDTQVPLEPEN